MAPSYIASFAILSTPEKNSQTIQVGEGGGKERESVRE
jgi:hypothetical protein